MCQRGKNHQRQRLLGALVGVGCLLGGCIKDGDLTQLPDASPPLQVNCEKEQQGIEFINFTIADFESPNSKSKEKVYQQSNNIYSYSDGTAKVLAHTDADGSVTSQLAGYQPPSVSAPRCLNEKSNKALHLSGGPFLGWGGGIGTAMMHVSETRQLCPLYKAGTPEQAAYCLSPAKTGDVEGEIINSKVLDLREWDGVAVWAKRGPGSQPLLRVLVGNKQTDDDLSFLMYSTDPKIPRYCERVKECACNNHKTCTKWIAPKADGGETSSSLTADGFYCGDPNSDPHPGTISTSITTLTNSCGITRCNEEYPAYPAPGGDPQFKDRPCTPFAMRQGIQSSYCFDPAKDPPPANSDEQCGDFWTFPLHLTTEWKLYLVPFTSMYQQGYGKRWPTFDRGSISVVRLTWDAGMIDYWIDDIRFYRVRRK